jgi:hypothetical protein
MSALFTQLQECKAQPVSRWSIHAALSAISLVAIIFPSESQAEIDSLFNRCIMNSSAILFIIQALRKNMMLLV